MKTRTTMMRHFSRSSHSCNGVSLCLLAFALCGCALHAHAATLPSAAACPVPPSSPMLPNEVPGASISAAQVDAGVARVDALAQDVMASGIPGMAIAVVAKGQVVFAKGYGVRSVDNGLPVDADTVFALASVSKSIGATVVANQVGQGVVRWDTPLRQYIPSFRLKDAYVGSHATIGDVYAHRVGLPEHAGDLLEDIGFDRTQIIDRLRYYPLTPYRVSYAYTNIALTAGAQAVANAANTDWAMLSERVLYTPLGMTSTSSRYADLVARSDRAFGHVRRDGRYQVADPQRDADAQSPAGGVSSSVNDLAKWMNMVLAQGCANGQPLVDSKALLAAISPQIVSAAPATPQARAGFYGYGFNVSDSAAGRVVLTHSGAFAMGAATAFTLIPSANVGIVTLTNAEPSGLPETLNAEFADLVQFGAVTQDWKTLYAGAFANLIAPEGSLFGLTAPANPAPARSASKYVGNYSSELYGWATIAASDDNLILTLGPARMQFPLRHWDGDTFTFTPPGESQPPGSISKLSFVNGGLTIEYLDAEGLGTFWQSDLPCCKF